MLTAKQALKLAEKARPKYDAELLQETLATIEHQAKRFASTSIQVSRQDITPGLEAKLLDLGYSVIGHGYDDYLTVSWEPAE